MAVSKPSPDPDPVSGHEQPGPEHSADSTSIESEVPAGAVDSMTATAGNSVTEPASATRSAATRPSREKGAAQGRHRVGIAAAADRHAENDALPPKARLRDVAIPFLISVTVHGLFLLLLGYWVLPADVQEEILAIISVPVEKVQSEDDAVETLEQPEELNIQALDKEELEQTTQQFSEIPAEQTIDFNDLAPSLDLDLPNLDGPKIKLPQGEFAGRSIEGRQQRAIASGGSEASERSVVLGLKWLQQIQRPDGSWNFNTVGEGTDGAGSLDNPMGATAMVLLAYLGAGHTNHSKTPYRNTMAAGLEFLLKNGKLTADGLDLRGSVKRNEGMYVQGLCTIALCEAYGMASAAYKNNLRGRDKTGMRRFEFQTVKLLKAPAQAALNFVVRAQHLEGGGWRYSPGQPGDTSVVGWQIMALQSGRAAGLSVPDPTLRRAEHFLDSVAVDGGAQYGYDAPSANRPVTTAVGLLCRMYTGWKRENPALIRGIAYLSKTAPARDNMYYNYYATQVMHHWGGEEWKKWNAVMREQLITTQVQEGPAAGSWNPTGPHADIGGRIVETCFSIMSLEVYYRHLPLYKKVTSSAEQF